MKKMYKNKAMNHFINAAVELIDEKGIENLTIRAVAAKAGYNSATLYNYFENLDHLIFFAAMKNIKDYSLSLNMYLVNTKNSMDRFLRVWECFCKFAYKKPEIYNAIFFANLSKDMQEYVSEYYLLFPDELGIHHQTISTMLLKADINDRNMTTVMDCVDEGFIDSKNADKLNDMTLLFFEGMLKRVLRNKVSCEDAIINTMNYIKITVQSLLIKEYDFYY